MIDKDKSEIIPQFHTFCDLRCFVAIYALLRGEKLSQKCVCGERLQIYPSGSSYITAFKHSTTIRIEHYHTYG